MSQETFRYTSAPKRREQLTQFIAEHGYCSIVELSDAFAVSEMTIRRDVTRLVEAGLVRGFRGGVGSLSRQGFTGTDYGFRDISMPAEKHSIASRAVGAANRHSVIAIDAGTTANQLAALLPSGLDITVITNSFPVIENMIGRSGTNVVCLGGTLHPESLSFDGTASLAGVENLRIETFFLGASGIGERGAFCANAFDAITKRALIDVSQRVVLLADSSKFAASAMVKICDWDAVQSVIIDDGITDEQREMLAGKGVEVDVVPVHAPESAAEAIR